MGALEGSGRGYLGVNWPSDVVSGWLLGALLTVPAAGVFGRLRRSRFLDGAAGGAGTPVTPGRQPGPSRPGA